MLESILSQATTTTTTTLTLQQTLICTAASVVIGFVISLVYMACSKKYSKNYVITLVILPVLVQVVIMMVNGNLGTGVAILGAFSLVRFRSIPGSSKEIGIIFFAMAIGLATGMGYLAFAGMIAVVVSLVLVVLHRLNYGGNKEYHKTLKILIPENLDFDNLFTDLLNQYTSEYSLEKVKTTNMGSMFELTYNVVIKENISEKKMIDDIRCRNGNLMVACGRTESTTEEL